MTQMSSIAGLSGLVGYWPCDELTGATVNDVTSSPANGALSGSGSVLAPWNSPGGVGAVGLRPTTATLASSAALTVASATKLNVGDTFTVGMFFRRRAAVTGSLYARGTYYGSLGSELLTNNDFEGSTLTPWQVPVGTVTLDTSVRYAGSKSARLDVNSSADNVGVNQYAYSSGAAAKGRYTLTFWYKNDSNTAGQLAVRVTYTDASSATKNLQSNDGVFSTTSAGITVPYSSTWTQYTVSFNLTESATELNVGFGRLYGAGGGTAYSMWVDSTSLKCQPVNSGACALNLDNDGTLTFEVGETVVASSSVPIDEYLHWHYVVLTKSGATTKIYVDGVDVTVSGTNATVSATGSVGFFSSGIGLQPVVGAHLFVVNRAITAAEQFAIYSAANMLPDRAGPRSLKQTRFGFSGESTSYGFVPAFYSPPETISAAARRTHSTWMRELFDWWQVEQTQGTRNWAWLDRVVDAHVANGMGVLAVFHFHSPGWALGYGTLNSGNPLTQTVPGSASKGISVAAANNNATNGGRGANAYTNWRNNFIAFIVAAVHRYKDRVFEWELGNEGHTDYFAGPAASALLFVDFYNTARAAVLAELGTDAYKHKISLGGLCRYYSELGNTNANSYTGDEFLRAILDNGIAPFDRIGIHPYLSSNGDPAVHTINGLNLDGVHQMHDTLLEYGKTPLIEIGEIGWNTEDTTIAAASNGLTLPQSTITVTDATLLPYTVGTLYVETSLGFQAVTYTGKTGNTLTGCSGGTGVISTGGLVSGSYSQPVAESQAAIYLSSCLALFRDCLSSFCDGFFYHTTSGTYNGAGALIAWKDLAMLKPKLMVERYSSVAALYDAALARPVQTPLIGAPTATSGDPVMGAINIYNASGGAVAVSLPPLARLAPGARLMVGKSDSSANTLTVNCSGVDTFLDGTTSVVLSAGMQREIQVVSVSDVKVWAFLGSTPKSVTDNGDGTATS